MLLTRFLFEIRMGFSMITASYEMLVRVITTTVLGYAFLFNRIRTYTKRKGYTKIRIKNTLHMHFNFKSTRCRFFLKYTPDH